MIEVLHRDFTIAGTFLTGASFLAAIESLKADIVLLDISLEDILAFAWPSA